MKVSELSGVTLDWWVAKADGLSPKTETGVCIVYPPSDGDGEEGLTFYEPSLKWSHGGPIIERMSIERERQSSADGMDAGWSASVEPTTKNPDPPWLWGETQLIASMRAYVASKYGDEVPEE